MSQDADELETLRETLRLEIQKRETSDKRLSNYREAANAAEKTHAAEMSTKQKKLDDALKEVQELQLKLDEEQSQHKQKLDQAKLEHDEQMAKSTKKFRDEINTFAERLKESEDSNVKHKTQQETLTKESNDRLYRAQLQIQAAKTEAERVNSQTKIQIERTIEEERNKAGAELKIALEEQAEEHNKKLAAMLHENQALKKRLQTQPPSPKVAPPQAMNALLNETDNEETQKRQAAEAQSSALKLEVSTLRAEFERERRRLTEERQSSEENLKREQQKIQHDAELRRAEELAQVREKAELEIVRLRELHEQAEKERAVAILREQKMREEQATLQARQAQPASISMASPAVQPPQHTLSRTDRIVNAMLRRNC